MTVTFNHTIIAAQDRHESARFFCELFELSEAPSWGVFTNIQLDEGVLLQFAEPPVEIQMQHYAFLVDDDLFDREYQRLCDREIEHWADPQMKRPGEINTEHGGRGVYFKDPAGHAIEMITRLLHAVTASARASAAHAPAVHGPGLDEVDVDCTARDRSPVGAQVLIEVVQCQTGSGDFLAPVRSNDVNHAGARRYIPHWIIRSR